MDHEFTQCDFPSRVLIVSPGTSFGDAIREVLDRRYPGQVIVARSEAEARELIARDGDDICIAVAELDGSDGQGARVADMILDNDIPALIVADETCLDEAKRLVDKGAFDFVDRNVSASLSYVDRFIHRIRCNLVSKALVVDDSPTYRAMVREFLEFALFEVFEAEDGESALDVMKEHDDIRLAIVDHEMPGMDGFTLVTRLRQNFDAESLAIIGLSGSDQEGLGVSFIKYGADDFISKPFQTDEFLVRVNDCLRKSEMLRELKQRATTDYLTGLFNRHHFYELARSMYASAKRGHLALAAVMMDIDHFKNVNDTHGHAAGDAVLRAVAEVLTQRVREADLAARMGGEEFCILAINADVETMSDFLDEIRKRIEETVVEVNGAAIKTTVSMGACMSLENGLDEMLNAADAALYEAKRAGRNRIVFSKQEETK